MAITRSQSRRNAAIARSSILRLPQYGLDAYFASRAVSAPNRTVRNMATQTARTVRRPYTANRTVKNQATGYYKKKKSKSYRRKRYNKKKRTSILSGKVNKSKCMTLGITSSQETSLERSDANAVYVTAAGYCPDVMLRTAIQAMIRKLLETKGGVQVTGVNSTKWNGFTYNNTTGWMIQLISVNTSTHNRIIEKEYKTVVNETLENIALQFQTSFEEYANKYQNGIGANDYQLESFGLYMNNTNPLPDSGQPMIFKGQILFDDEYINYYCSNELKIQNRTLATNGNEYADDVRNNPIQGLLYYFNGLPNVRDNSLSLFARTPYKTGIKTNVPSEMYDAYGMIEPPSRKLFTNCYSSKKIVINPGVIQRYTLYIEKKMKFQDFINATDFHADYEIASATRFKGKSMMVALEDVINLNSTNLISVALEINRFVGVYWSTHRKKSVVPTYYSNIVVPPPVPPLPNPPPS